ncbi:MAG TPA: protease complex subunit PrcB family protein [Longimicrobium sp.]|nr:protease complex subunit PrcB family protein [Longimicrobium sp.]
MATPFVPDGSGPFAHLCRTLGGRDSSAAVRVRVGAADLRSMRRVLHVESSEVAAPLRCVVRSAAEANRVLPGVTADPRGQVGSVDFAREMVLAASSGTQPNTGHDILIDAVWMRGDTVIARVRRLQPADGEPVGQMRVTPLDAVAIPRSAGPVVFLEALHP